MRKIQNGRSYVIYFIHISQAKKRISFFVFGSLCVEKGKFREIAHGAFKYTQFMVHVWR